MSTEQNGLKAGTPSPERLGSAWTSELPTRTGWYWQKGLELPAEIVFVTVRSSGKKVISYGPAPNFTLEEFVKMDPYTLWAGPLVEPELPNAGRDARREGGKDNG